MAVTAVVFACLMDMAASKYTIQSHDGWHMSWKINADGTFPNIPGSDDFQEWRNFGGAWFTCYLGGLEEVPDAQGFSTFTERALPNASGSKAFYTSAPNHAGYGDHMLVKTWNETLGFIQIRMCRIRAIEDAWSFFSCPPPFVRNPDEDCPPECLEESPVGDQPCQLKYHDEKCLLDTRCVPDVARDPSRLPERPLSVENGLCLAGNKDVISAEVCDGSDAQKWTFTNQDALLV